MNTPFYSIIIPHYNTPLLLRRCLQSIPKRHDLQIIVVDDKSSDDSIAQLSKIQNEFPFVFFLFSEENGGGGRARNVGLKYAKGKYVLFADADDFFNYCLNEILDKYLHEEHDVVYFNAICVDTITYLPTKRISSPQKPISIYEKTGDMKEIRFLFGEPWCKLIRKEILDKNNIIFDEIFIHNDTKFSYLVGYYCENAIVDNRGLYCLADRVGSVSKGVSNDKQKTRLQVFAEKNRFLKDHNIDIFDEQMLMPFRTYIKKRNLKLLLECFYIAKEYDYSWSFILRRLLKQEFCFVINGIRTIFHVAFSKYTYRQ